MKKYLLLTLLALLNFVMAVAQEPYAVFNEGTLAFFYDNAKNEKVGTVYALNTGDDMPGWTQNPSIAQNISMVVFDTSFANARPVSTAGWFGVSGTSSLTTIKGIEYLNTSCVTSMKAMFYGCTQLTTLDLSHFDTRNVTNMEGMFRNCSGLTKLDLSLFETSNVTNMEEMFANCSQLTTLDLSHFDTRNVTDMDWMFGGCGSLTTIYCGINWNTNNVDSSSNMFYGCTSLVGGNGTGFNTGHTDKTYAHVDGGSDNPGYLTCADAYALFQNGTLTFYYDGKKNERQGQGTVFELNTGDNIPGWSNDSNINPNITKVVFDTSFANARPVSTVGWFINAEETSSLTTIEGIENLNTSSVTTMTSMFFGCTKLTTLDLSHFDTRNVTSMGGMFFGCTGLTMLDLSHFDTRNVTNMYLMFGSCSNLTTIYCSDNWNTDKVTNSSYMFNACTNLMGGKGTTYDASHLDAAYAHIDEGASNPGYLTPEELIGAEAYAVFNNSTLTFYFDKKKTESEGTAYELNSGDNAPGWVGIASSITKVVFDTSFANAWPVSTFAWFYDVTQSSSLTTIEGLENLNTSCVTTMASMFATCSGLTTLDLSHFDTHKVTNMASMFTGCGSLTTIYCGDNWNTDNVVSSTDMFWGCSKLKGGKGTEFSPSHIDKVYARIDEGASSPGYLSLKGDTNGDNAIDAQDASLILQYVAKKIDSIQNADINGDGVVDAQDASLILQYVAKKITW